VSQKALLISAAFGLFSRVVRLADVQTPVKSRERQWVETAALARNRGVGIRNAAFLVASGVSGLTISITRLVFPSWLAQLPGRNAVHIRKLAN